MRMFLVGMCDIFLLLYLTHLTQIDASMVSDLTVQDYLEVKVVESQLKDSLKKTEDELKAALQREAEVRALAKVQEEQVEALRLEQTEVLEKTQQEIEAARKAAEAARKLAEETQRIAEEARQRERAAREEAGRLLDERGKAVAAAESAKKEKEAFAAREAEAVTQALAAEKKYREARKTEARALHLAKTSEKDAEESDREKEQAKKLAEEARKEAEEARRRAEQAREEAKEAQEREESAWQEAQEAEGRKEEALKKAKTSREMAALAKAAESRATRRAVEAISETMQTKREIREITQPARKAYRENVYENLVPASIQLKTRNVLGISSEEKINLVAVPVRMGKEHLVFLPLDHVGIDLELKAKRFERFRVEAEKAFISKIYLSPKSPHIMGFVLSLRSKSVLPAAKTKDLSSYTPTLLAVRNKQRMDFFDRLRDLDEDYFVFKRDHLRQDKNGALRYAPDGIRGTGDYAEYIIAGDQVVTVQGRFVGVAVENNTIIPIPSLAGWKSFNLGKISTRNLINQMKNWLRSQGKPLS